MQKQAKKIHQLIELQANNNPNNRSLVYGDAQLTYNELNRKANQFAHFLQSQGVKPGDIIPIVSDKSINSLIAIFGILKAGAAYSPLNTENSNNHIDVVFKETGAKFACMGSTSLINRFNFNEISPINLEDLDLLTGKYPTTNIEATNSEIDLAYVIYTSGTTGNPKGVMINHANLIPTYFSWEDAYNLTSSDIHLQMASFSFDVFVGDWMRALGSGATLVLCPKEILLDPRSLYELIVKEKINGAEFVPAVLRNLMSFIQAKSLKLNQMRLVICGSDQWTMKEYRSFKALCGESTRLISSYGLTETTIDSSYFEEMETDNHNLLRDTDLVPIGKPFNRVRLYLIAENMGDKNYQLVAPGEIGEICIGGLGVGPGYLNRPELTSQRYITNICSEIPNDRVYRTGDQGKILPDGNLLFLGRNQGHVKVNGGMRVEIPTLEAAINEHPKVKFAIVIPISKEDMIILQCYLISKDRNDPPSYEDLTKSISSALPCYYVPRKFFEVKDIPLSLNGKVDKNPALQQIIKELRPILELPKNDVQEKLITIWKEVLEVHEIGIKSNFHFQLGGSSLTYVKIVNIVNTHFNVNLPKGDFETIEQMADQVQKCIDNNKNSVVSLSREEYEELKNTQKFQNDRISELENTQKLQQNEIAELKENYAQLISLIQQQQQQQQASPSDAKNPRRSSWDPKMYPNRKCPPKPTDPKHRVDDHQKSTDKKNPSDANLRFQVNMNAI